MNKLAFYIDQITNSIKNAATLESAETDVIPLDVKELKKVHKKSGWLFNWRSEFNIPEGLLFKLIVRGSTVIEGLISLQLSDTYVDVQLIETAPHNFGRSKKWIGVSGNLVAFA